MAIGSSAGLTPYDFVLESAKITADRAPSSSMEISEAVIEINLYEHIEKPYMTGDLVIGDTVDLFTLGDFQGTEKIEIIISFPGEGVSKIHKNFIIDRIETSRKGNDTVEIIIFHLVEDILFKSKTGVISKGYDGKPSQIIENILLDGKIGRTLNVSKTEAQETCRYLVPYLPPLDACLRLKDLSTTEKGYPYFLFSNISSDKELMFRSLEDMYKTAPILPFDKFFIYSLYSTGLQDAQINDILYEQEQSAGSNQEDLQKNRAVRKTIMSLTDKGRTIENYHVKETQDLLTLITRGRVGASVSHTDLSSGTKVEHKVDMKSVFDQMTSDLFPRDQRINSYDDKAFGGVHNKTARNISQVFTSNTYDGGVANIYDGGSRPGASIRNIMTSNVVKSLFKKEAVDVQMPGYNFWPRPTDPHRTIGRRLPLGFARNDADIVELGIENSLDRKRSGDYIAFAACHSFNTTKYTVTLTAIKLSSRGNPSVRPTGTQR